MTKLAVVILNWNGQAFLKQFLPSVVKFSDGAKIVVIDNASTDNSIEFLEENYPEIQRIVLDKNYGFAEGYNRGLQQIEATYYVLLNSDVALTPNCWQPLLELLESNPQIGAVQPKIKSYQQKEYFEYAGACGGFLDKYGYPFCRGRILDTLEKDHGQYDTLQRVFWASGAAMCVRAEVLHKLGGFDVTFFAHMEEIDLCWRMQDLGYEIYCEPKSTVYHVGGGTLPNESPFKLYLNFRNNLFMLYKNLPSNNFLPLFLMRMFLDGVAAFKYLFSGNSKAFVSVWKAHMAFYKNLPRLREERERLRKECKIEAKCYNKSILWHYFISKKTHFSELEL